MKRKAIALLIVLTIVLGVAFAFASCNPDDNHNPDATAYSVTFVKGDGATGDAPTMADQVPGTTFQLPSASGIAKDGHHFSKWNDGESDYSVGADYTMPDHAVTFTAVWVLNGGGSGYAMTFKPGDHATGLDYVKYVDDLSSVIMPTASDANTYFSAESGYVLSGWQVEGTSTVYPAGEVVSVSGATTFVAQWTDAITIQSKGEDAYITLYPSSLTGVLNYDNGTQNGAEVELTYTLSGTSIAVKIGSATFNGTLDGTTLTINISVGGKTLEFGPVELVKPTIIFNANGGSGDAPTMTFNWDMANNCYKGQLPACTFTAPAGKTFKGWKFENELQYETVRTVGSAITAQSGETLTIYAIWKDENPSDFVIEAGVLKEYNGSATAVEVPAGVQKIAANAFKNKTSIVSIDIPESVTEIAGGAFGGMSGLRFVVLRSKTEVNGMNCWNKLTAGRKLTVFAPDELLHYDSDDEYYEYGNGNWSESSFNFYPLSLFNGTETPTPSTPVSQHDPAEYYGFFSGSIIVSGNTFTRIDFYAGNYGAIVKAYYASTSATYSPNVDTEAASLTMTFNHVNYKFTCVFTDKNTLAISVKDTYDANSDPITATFTRMTTYTVTFSLGEATGTAPAAVKVASGDSVTKPASDPTWAGHLFDGWYNGSAATAYVFSTPVTGDITLTAHWSVATPATISFAHSSLVTGTMESASVTKGEAYTLPDCTFTAPTGYTFLGWKGTNSYSPDQTKVAGSTFEPTEDTTLTAVFKKSVTGEIYYENVTINLRDDNKATFGNATYAQLYDYTMDGAIITFEDSKYDAFSAKVTGNTFVVLDGMQDVSMVSTDGFTLSFDGAGGATLTKESTTKGGTYSLSVVSSNYVLTLTFDGTDYPAKLKGDYPNYTINKVVATHEFGNGGKPTVVFVKNDANATGSDPTVDPADNGDGTYTITLPANPYSVTGKTFSTWKIGSTDYAPNATYTAQEDEDVTIKAIWSGGSGSTPTAPEYIKDYMTRTVDGTPKNIVFGYESLEDAGTNAVKVTDFNTLYNAQITWTGSQYKMKVHRNSNLESDYLITTATSSSATVTNQNAKLSDATYYINASANYVKMELGINSDGKYTLSLTWNSTTYVWVEQSISA